MKQIIIFIFILAFTTMTFAQPTDKRLAADLKRLNSRFESVERIKRMPKDGNSEIRIKRAIESAERNLERFRKKHPDYNVSKYETALADFKNPSRENLSSGSTTISRKSTVVSDFAKAENLIEMIEEILKFNPDASALMRAEEGSLEKSKKQLEDFRKKMEKRITPEFVKLANDQSNRRIKRIAQKAERHAESSQNRIGSIDTKSILAETDQGLMLSKYFQALFMAERLNLLNKIYADNQNIITARKASDSLIAELGTIEDIKIQGEKNYAALVAKRRLYPARQNNAALKKDFIRAFKSSPFTQKLMTTSQILKLNLVSSGWSVQRNKITGIILTRDQQGHFAIKTADGKCHSYLVLFEQKYQGGSKYSRSYMRSGTQREMLCSNVPK